MYLPAINNFPVKMKNQFLVCKNKIDLIIFYKLNALLYDDDEIQQQQIKWYIRNLNALCTSKILI